MIPLCDYKGYAKEQIYDKCTEQLGYCECRHNEKLAEKMKPVSNKLGVLLALCILALLTILLIK